MNNDFMLLIKKEYVDNRKTVLLGVVGILATYILLGAFIGKIHMGCGTEIFLFLFLGGLIAGIVASLAFNNMKSKEERINALMLPAKISHKFMVRWTAAVPVMILLLLVGVILGDYTRLLVERLEGYPAAITLSQWYSTVSIFVNGDVPNKIAIYIGISVILAFLCSQSIYFFGAILWPKQSFIKTFAALQVIQILGGILLVLVDFDINFSKEVSLEWFFGILWTIGVVFCLGMYRLSYVRFRNSQVIYKLF